MSRTHAGTALSVILPIVLATASATAQSTAQPKTSVGSDAYDLGAVFTSQQTTMLGPVNEVRGAYPPAYAQSHTLASYSQTIAVPPLVPGVHPVIAEFKADAKHLASSVVSKGIQLDTISASAADTVGPTHLQIVTGNGPPGVAVILYLDITANASKGSASYSLVFPSAASVTGSATLDGLRIGGSLLGGQTVSFSGSPPNNTVLFQNSTVSVIANEEVIAGLISCGPTCRFEPATITVHPLSVHLNGAIIQGQPVTGEIDLGSATAY